MEIEIHSIQDLDKICRLCLKTSNGLISLFDLKPPDREDDNLQLLDIAMECTSIKIQKDDDLPKSICLDCLNSLENFHSFKKQCKAAHKYLTTLVQTLQEIQDTDSYIIYKNSTSDDDTKDDLDDFTDHDYFMNKEDKPKVKEEESDTPMDTAEDVKIENESNDSDDPSDPLYSEPQTEITENENKSKVVGLECLNCSKLFSTEVTLSRHRAKCKNDYTCDVCFKTFTDFNLLHSHVKNDHRHGESRIGLYECDICSEPFTNKNNLTLHFLQHIAVATYFGVDVKANKCYICTKSLKTYSAFVSHINLHFNHSNVKYQCSVCDEEIALEKEKFKQHVSQHGISIYQCYKCLLSFKDERLYKKHMQNHFNNLEKPAFKCALCDKSFANNVELKDHLLTHSADLYKCTICSNTANSYPEMMRHFKNHETSRVNVCPICGKSIPKYIYQDHIDVVHNKIEKKYNCTMCEKTFRSKFRLNVHIRVHSGERPFSCPFCEYASRSKHDLLTHVRFHTGERPFPCKIPGCDKRFTISCHRRDHMVRHHTGEKTYKKCNLCERSFTSNQSLKYHMLTHFNSHPHSCDICEKKFRRKSHLASHQKRIHGRE